MLKWECFVSYENKVFKLVFYAGSSVTLVYSVSVVCHQYLKCIDIVGFALNQKKVQMYKGNRVISIRAIRFLAYTQSVYFQPSPVCKKGSSYPGRKNGFIVERDISTEYMSKRSTSHATVLLHFYFPILMIKYVWQIHLVGTTKTKCQR